jgi:tRNA-Thr(GGU) m(6)t(6)A37 methyltransferase TsaA
MENMVEMRVIGVARTAYGRREDAPHQPTDAVGTLEIAPAYRKGLADLASFRRVWVLFVFDRNEGFVLRVKPPRGGAKRGVFATRAPHRPSPIGLTNAAVKSVDVERGLVELEGVDFLDETPILDLKPYLPMVDAHPGAGHGWLEPFLEKGIEPRLKKPRR